MVVAVEVGLEVVAVAVGFEEVLVPAYVCIESVDDRSCAKSVRRVRRRRGLAWAGLCSARAPTSVTAPRRTLREASLRADERGRRRVGSARARRKRASSSSSTRTAQGEGGERAGG